jgi:mycothione reductase
MRGVRHFDLCVLGSGSANSIIDSRFDHLSVAQVDGGTFGGTCINVGCVPTKMFVHPADLARTPSDSGRLGVDLELRQVHWGEIRDRIFGRIDKITEDGRRYRVESDNVTFFGESARFAGPRRIELSGGETLTADRFVLGVGSRVFVPDIPGLPDVAFHTSDTVMRLPRLPASMIIVGGGYVAAEFAHIFSSFGTRVTVINRSDRLLRKEDAEVAERFTEQLSRYVDLQLSQQIERVESGPSQAVTVHTRDEGGGSMRHSAEILLVATGRRTNADTLDLEQTGVEVDDDGYVMVDDQQATSVPEIFALGDVSSRQQLKHAANADARVVQHNLLHPDDPIAHDHRLIPHAIFSDPQIASIGLTEEQAREGGVRFVSTVQDYGSVAYGWAMEDVAHFVKLLADPQTGLLLGAHLIGPQASTLIQPLIQAMTFGLPAHEMARGQYWIHPALTEVVENALLALPLPTR